MEYSILISSLGGVIVGSSLTYLYNLMFEKRKEKVIMKSLLKSIHDEIETI